VSVNGELGLTGWFDVGGGRAVGGGLWGVGQVKGRGRKARLPVFVSTLFATACM